MRSAIITGAYGAIGKAICEGVARAGYEVTLVGRNPEKLAETRDQLARATSNSNLFIEVIGLSSQQSIKDFSRRWNKPLHLLINVAATAPRRRTETSEGIEMQWAVNVLAYFWMIRYFHPFMEHQPDARIINVASYWAGGMDLRDPEFKHRPYDNDTAYRQAKQANRMMSVAFAERLSPMGITVNSCHPGDVDSKLSNSFGFKGDESPREGAATPLFLALSDQVKGVTGKYFEHLHEVRCTFSEDKKKVDALFQLLENTGGTGGLV